MNRSVVKSRQWTRLQRLHDVFGFVLIVHVDGIFSEISIVTPNGRRSMKSTDLGNAVDALFELLTDQGLVHA